MLADNVVSSILEETEDLMDAHVQDYYNQAAGVQDYGGQTLDNIIDDLEGDTSATWADWSSIIDDAVDGVKSWVLNQFSSIGINLEGILGDFGDAVGVSLDALGVDVYNIVAATNTAIEVGLEDAGAALSSGLGTIRAEIGGILDAVGEAVDPIVTGLNLGFGFLLDGFKDMLKIDIDEILDAQAKLSRRAIERQIKDLAPLEAPP